MVGGYAVFSADWGSGRETWRVPMVLDVETSYNASLTEIPTMIYGVDSNFVMDLGTVRQFYLSCARVHADNVSDPDDPEHGDLSNGEWIKGFRAFWDHWQNLSYEDGRIQGGADFQFIPEFAQDRDAADGDSELIPPIGTNVFLMGSLSPKYGVQKMTWSMQLLEARVFSEDVVTKRVTMTFRVGYDGKSEDQVRSYPVGSQFKLPNPTAEQSALLKDGSIVTAWEYNGLRFDFGTAFVASESMEGRVYTAVLESPAMTVVRFLSHNEIGNDCVVPDGCTKANVILVGAGGRCGSSRNQDDDAAKERYTGGGGGSGQTKQFTFTGLTGGDKVSVTVGEGLFNTDSSGNGSEIEFVLQSGKTLKGSASGGLAGGDATDARKGAAGGTKYNKGGSSPQSGYSGGDGEGDIGIPGKGGEPGTRNSGAVLYGGCGGGAADLDIWVSKAAIIATGLYVTDDAFSMHWNHGQLSSNIQVVYSSNIEISKVDNSLGDATVSGTIVEEGPAYYLVQISDRLSSKRFYRGYGAFYVKDDTDTSGMYHIQSCGGDGKSGADSGTGSAHGYMGGGGGSNAVSGYGGDGAVIINFFK